MVEKHRKTPIEKAAGKASKKLPKKGIKKKLKKIPGIAGTSIKRLKTRMEHTQSMVEKHRKAPVEKEVDKALKRLPQNGAKT